MVICLCLSRTVKVNGHLAALGLQISLRERFVSFSWHFGPMLRFACSGTSDTILFLVQVQRNTNDLPRIASRIRQHLLRLHDMFAHFVAGYSMSVNIDMKKIIMLKSHGYGSEIVIISLLI